MHTDLREHLARERRLSAWLARVRDGEPVECRAIKTESPPPTTPRGRGRDLGVMGDASDGS